MRRLNEMHSSERQDDSRLSARIESFELAFRMQSEAPEAFDLARETEATRRLYGIGDDVDRRLWPPVPAGAPARGAGGSLCAALPHDRRLPTLGPAQ